MTHHWEVEKLRSFAKGSGADMGCGSLKIGRFGIDFVPFPNVNLVCDMARVPLDTASLDYIISCHSLEHCPDTVAVLREWFRLLKSGATLAIYVPDGDKELAGILGDTSGTHRQLFTTTTLTKFLTYCGFLVEETECRLTSLFVLAHKPPV